MIHVRTNIVPVHPDTGRSYLLKPLPDENNLGTRSSLAAWQLAEKDGAWPEKAVFHTVRSSLRLVLCGLALPAIWGP